MRSGHDYGNIMSPRRSSHQSVALRRSSHPGRWPPVRMETSRTLNASTIRHSCSPCLIKLGQCLELGGAGCQAVGGHRDQPTVWHRVDHLLALAAFESLGFEFGPSFGNALAVVQDQSEEYTVGASGSPDTSRSQIKLDCHVWDGALLHRFRTLVQRDIGPLVQLSKISSLLAVRSTIAVS
jgi:hypothetical protein